MSNYKRQHYVPRFYLGNFSSDGKFISGYNLKQHKFFSGPIQTTCTDSYFYSKDSEIERSLSLLEAKVSSIMKKINTTKKLPVSFEDRFLLYTFMMLQHGRTAAAKDSAREMTAKQSEMFTEAFKATNLEIVWNADYLYSMLVAFTSTPLIMDLRTVLLINTTMKKFITSDNPVILHNTCFNAIKTHGTDGFQSKGLQIFWPISSSVAILLYDPGCYTLKPENDEIEITSEQDICALNALQFLYCRENVLFESKENEDQVKWLNDNIKPYRNEKRWVRKKFPHPFKHNAEIHHFYEQNLDYNLELSFIEIKKGATSGVRDQKRIDEFKKFFERIMEREKKSEIE